MFCPNCGKQMEPTADGRCPFCGKNLSEFVNELTSRDADQPRKKPRLGLIVGGGILLAAAAAVLLLVVLPRQQRVKEYNEAVDLLDSGSYTVAAERFRALSGFEDADKLAEYAAARDELQQGHYSQAAEAFARLGAFMDAPTHLATAQRELLYANATDAMGKGDYATALAALEQIPDLRDAGELAKKCRSEIAFGEAQTLYANGSFADAIALLEGIPDMPEAQTLKKACEDGLTYATAKARYEAGAFEEAIALLKGIPDMPEAKTLQKACEDSMVYASAREKYESGAYAEAIALLKGIPDMPEAKTLQKTCEDSMVYASAQEKYAAGDYEASAKLFSDIPGVKDAADMAQESRKQLHYQKIQAALDKSAWADALTLLNQDLAKAYPDRRDVIRLCNDHIDYEAAAKALAEGHNYDAYLAFTALGDFEDAAEKAKSCVVKKPKNGETYRNKKYKKKDCQQWVITPDDGIYTYMKIYAVKDSKEVLVSCLFIRPGKTVKITLPAGNYIYKVAYGKGNWYGETDMFGDEGNYQRAGGSDYVFKRKKLKSGQYYELKLRVGDGNMGSSWENRGGF